MKRCQHSAHIGRRLVDQSAFPAREDRPDLLGPFCKACVEQSAPVPLATAALRVVKKGRKDDGARSDSSD